MNRSCVTNLMQWHHPRMRPTPCRESGLHEVTCPNPDRCWGCLPRQADVGFLCWHCYEKARDAVARVGLQITHLRSIESAGGRVDDVRVRTSRTWRLPVPDSWLTADELMVALGAEPIPAPATVHEVPALVDAALEPWTDVETAVSTREGAERAVQLVLLMQTSLHRWPDTESNRRLPETVRCKRELAMKVPGRDGEPTKHVSVICSGMLYRSAPLDYLGDVVVLCDACGGKHDWWELAERIQVEGELRSLLVRREEQKRRRAAMA